MARILIVDDDAQFRKMLRMMLEKGGHEIFEAPDGKVGLALYKKDPTDLVISDIFMPHKEGLQTIKELRQDFPDAKIIAVSGGGKVKGFDYLDDAELFGANRTLAKPFTGKDVLAAVGELLDQK